MRRNAEVGEGFTLTLAECNSASRGNGIDAGKVTRDCVSDKGAAGTLNVSPAVGNLVSA